MTLRTPSDHLEKGVGDQSGLGVNTSGPFAFQSGGHFAHGADLGVLSAAFGSGDGIGVATKTVALKAMGESLKAVSDEACRVVHILVPFAESDGAMSESSSATEIDAARRERRLMLTKVRNRNWRARQKSRRRPEPELVDEAILRALLDTSAMSDDDRKARMALIKSVANQAVLDLVGRGHRDVGLAVAERGRQLDRRRVIGDVQRLAGVIPEPGKSTPGDTPVTPTDRIVDVPHRISDTTTVETLAA